MATLTKKYIFEQKLKGLPVTLASFQSGNDLELLIDAGVLRTTAGEVIRVLYPITVPMKPGSGIIRRVVMNAGASIHESNFK